MKLSALAHGYFLKTARLGFRCWAASDLPLAVALWGNPEVTRLIGGPFCLEEVKERLDQEIASMTAHHVQYWPLFLLGSHEHVGCGGLRLHKPQDQVYEMGIHLRPEYWGRRLAEEAGRAIITFAFETPGAKGLFAGHHPANAASRRLLEKLGFHFTHAELYPPTRVKHSSYLLTCGDAPN